MAIPQNYYQEFTIQDLTPSLENHFPAEIENALLEHPDVSDLQVIGIPDEKWGEVIAAFIRAEAGVILDKDALHQHCRGLLSPQKTPTIWVQVEAFPMPGSGKIQKFKLRERYLAGYYSAHKEAS